MRRITLRGLGARKLRTALTATAILLGVALMAGTFVLTDTIDRSFGNVFTQASSGYDVSITPKEYVDGTTDDGTSSLSIPETLLPRVRRVDGVDAAIGTIFSQVVLLRPNGKRLTNSGGAPNFVASETPKPFSPFTYETGRPPHAPGEAALDRFTADRAHVGIGDRIRIAGQGPARTVRLVGLVGFGSLGSLAGASSAIVTLPEAQRFAGKAGGFDDIEVVAASGVSATTLRDRLRAALPASVTVRTSAQQAQKQADDLQQFVSILRIALLVFGGIALFVGGFMIFNTFSMTVAQRAREFAMLRTIGASRRQILHSVIGEALLVGIAASVIGLAVGIALAPALTALFKALGADLPAEGIVVKPRTVIASLLVGTLITVLSALMPALRATRVPPIAALREGAVLPTSRAGRLRVPIAIGIAVLGVLGMLVGLFGGGSGGQGAGLLGAGAALVFIGVGLFSSELVRPLAALVGRPLQAFGISGRLARENATRNPSRTAGTAAALMIGLALVTFVSIFAAGIKGSVDQSVRDTFKSELVIMNDDGFTPFTTAAPRAVAQVPGVAAVSPLASSAAKVRGVSGTTSVEGVDPATFGQTLKLDWQDGSAATLAALGDDEIIASDSWASDHGLAVGDQVHATTPIGRRLTLTVRGIYEAKPGIGANYLAPAASLERDYGSTKDVLAAVRVTPGTDVATVQQRLDRLMQARFPEVKTSTLAQFTADQRKSIDPLIAMIYVLLSLSVIVSLFGIVNTLALAIHERTRELGMLRAIGISRRQVRRLVRYESVITALLGAILGMVLGVVFAVIITLRLADEGFTLSIPVGTLIVLFVLAALAGVLAAISPARRAAKLDVLQALAYE